MRTKIIPSEIKFQTFKTQAFVKIKFILENIPQECYQNKDTKKIMQYINNQTLEEKQSLMWIVAIEPCYYVQYKKQSAAIFYINKTTVIVYRPKYIEYPQIPKMAALQHKEGNCKVEIIKKGLFRSDTFPEQMRVFVQKYYNNYFQNQRNYDNFETELIKNVKGYLSFHSGVMYWHCILANKKTQIFQFDRINTKLVLKIEAKGYQKELYLFSLKGINNPAIEIIKNKWKELFAFLLLFLLLITLVMCPRNILPESEYTRGLSNKQKFCSNKDTIYFVVGSFFMVMAGMRFARRPPRFNANQQQ